MRLEWPGHSPNTLVEISGETQGGDMAVVLITTAPSREQYEQLASLVGEGAPRGCIVHTATEVEGGVRIVDVWESRQHVEDFFQSKLGPAFAQAGIESQPPELTEPFRVERP
jgi:hypothetical protein